MTTKKPKSRPYKKFYADRMETFLLPPLAFKIWMYHYAREGAARKSWPSVKTVMDACAIASKRIFYAHRRYLLENGWLEKIGQMPTRAEGGRPVPIFKVTRGTIPSKTHKVSRTKGAKSEPNPDHKVNLTRAKSDPNLVSQSDPRSRFMEVDSVEVKPTEVKGAGQRSVSLPKGWKIRRVS